MTLFTHPPYVIPVCCFIFLCYVLLNKDFFYSLKSWHFHVFCM